MPAFSLSDSYQPAVWKQTIQEKTNAAFSLFNSVAVTRAPLLDEIASGPSGSADLPFFRDIATQANEIQVEGTAPTILGIGSGKQVVKMLNRVTANSITAEAKTLGFADPTDAFLSRVAARRLAQRQASLRSALTGIFSTALSANLKNVALETSSGQSAANLWSGSLFHDAVSLLGNLEMTLDGGAVWVHPTVLAAMKKADEIAYIKPSEGKPFIATYKGLPIFVDSGLTRAGTTSGTVFRTVILAPGAVLFGQKDQTFLDIGQKGGVDTASFVFDSDQKTNVEAIYDRTREIIHVDGLSYTGTVTGGSPTNTELATANKWTLAADSAAKVGVVAIDTNG